MSEKEKWAFRLLDILDCIRKIEILIADHKDETSFSEDWKSFNAAERNLQIIAEAVKHIPDHVKEEFADIEWRRIVDMRNVLVHEYDLVDENIVWKTIQENIPALKSIIEKIYIKYKD